MERTKKLTALAALVAVALAAPMAAEANTITGSVSMLLQQPTTPVLGGDYTSPYAAAIAPGGGLTTASQFNAGNSFLSAIICDDFTTDVSAGLVWQATVTNMEAFNGGNTSALKFEQGNSQQLQDYKTVAQLSEELVQVNPSSTTAQQLSYAIWYVFDGSHGGSSALSGLGAGDQAAALADYHTAYGIAQGADLGSYANIDIYTPNALNAAGVNGSQEYIVVNPVPEPATLSLLGLGLAGVGFMRRRKRA